ncbi:MAG TPA: tetratricopeptide repeat protein, partial [Thermoanaerobaculia bacterium]|jgi:tetratricopeptide (TPR) repeat protein
VSLGRALRELKNDTAAVEALSKAMQLDPGNVVAARLLADSHLALGDNVEAIKKYKLVHALLPGDDDLKQTIERLERELNPPAPVWSAEAEPPLSDSPEETEAESLPPHFTTEESPFDKTTPPFEEALATGDAEPMLAAHDESPFEEPVESATVAAFEIEQPGGMHIAAAPFSAELPGPPAPLEDMADVFAPVIAEAAPPAELTNTLTMAELYERQGLVHEAQHIYENILARDPENEGVRAKLDAVAPRVNPKIERLERWLTKVTRKEAGDV